MNPIGGANRHFGRSRASILLARGSRGGWACLTLRLRARLVGIVRAMSRTLVFNAVLWVAMGFVSCSRTSAEQPEPSLGRSVHAQTSFHVIRERWLLSTWDERLALESSLEAFRQRHRTDPLTRVAEAYLALLALHRGDSRKALALAHEVQQGPAGNTRDLSLLVQGAILARRGEPEAALQILDPLVGKLMDSFAQDLLHETVVNTAVYAHRWFQAIVYMNEWVHAANEADAPTVRKRIEALLHGFPPAALDTALRAMSTRQKDIWELALREALATHLARIAVTRSDPNLAKSLLETARTTVSEDELVPLARLATSAGGAPRIIDARVGWLVETVSPAVSDRSAHALAGGLEVFKPQADAQNTAQTMSQAATGPPNLVFHDVSSGDSRQDAMDSLVRDGVSIVVGGYDPAGASELAAYAESHSIAVVLLVAPVPPPQQPRFSFILGEADFSWSDLRASQAVSQVEVGKSARLGPGNPPELPYSYDCEGIPARVGDTSFPVASWKSQKIEAVAIDGSAQCARRVLTDLQAIRYSPRVYLGLEAREAASAFSNDSILVASCGYFDSDLASIRAWRDFSGHDPTWFQALGRDAAWLARTAVEPLPRHTLTDVRDVMKAREETQSRLAHAQGVLWTTKSSGFGGSRTMPRIIHWVSMSDKRR
ncbi:MAG TPA: hypothetical protein PKK83_03065 [Polyangiaceae bacterium]|nr:MAG: hypothetical protein BWY17_01394 [Deltaproteobacteria bacterium ADurb.Bin207]HOD21247.1 hypothetical protein [Polyangiaceae bacterium]